MPPHRFKNPLPENPDPGLVEYERIIDRQVLVPALLGCSRIALGKARYWHAVAMRYRERLITERAAKYGASRRDAALAVDEEVLG